MVERNKSSPLFIRYIATMHVVRFLLLGIKTRISSMDNEGLSLNTSCQRVKKGYEKPFRRYTVHARSQQNNLM